MSIYDPKNANLDHYGQYMENKRQQAVWDEIGKTPLGDNKMYSRCIQDYFRCTMMYLDQFPYAPLLEQ